MRPAFVATSLAISALGLGIALAQEAPTMEPAPSMAPTPAQPALSAEDRERRARVYARVGEATVTVGDIEDAISKQQPFMRARYQNRERLKEFADTLVRFELFSKEAERRGYGDNPIVQRALKQNSVQQLIRREFDERITPESIPAADVQQYYDSHRDEFVRPGMVRASHILVSSQAEARRLVEQARTADARGFRQLAREHSIDTETKLRGGDLRYFTQDGHPAGARGDDPPVDENLVEAAFELETVGDVGRRPIRVGDNWSIVKLTGRRDAEERTLEQASQGIRVRLWRERRQQAIDDFVAALRRRHEPEIFPDRMEAIRLDPVEAASGLPGHPGEPGAAMAPHGRQAAEEAPAE